MITRKRILYSEKNAVILWQQAVGNKLRTTKNRRLYVIYPGRANSNEGPDFRDAVIAMNSHMMKGDVEVHVKTSDWYIHRHNIDDCYNNVILHVVIWNDCDSPTLLQNGKAIPVLCLAKALQQQAYLLPYKLPCYRILDHVDGKNLEKLLNTAGEKKFKRKARRLLTRITKFSQDIEVGQVLYQGLMRAIGYDKNTWPFEKLADRISLSYIGSCEGLAMKQALLLGIAGLLPSQRRQGKFTYGREIQKLEKIWREADNNLEAMKEDEWTLSHIYPNNSPVRRIIALSYLLERYPKTTLLKGILQLVEKAPITDGWRLMERGLTVTSDGYWWDHFDFNVTSKTKKSAILGNSKVSEIIVNIILPFTYAWGILNSEKKLSEKSIAIYRHYHKLAENYVTQHMKKQLCIEKSLNLTTCHQQGLIYIFRNYCSEGRCLHCPLIQTYKK